MSIGLNSTGMPIAVGALVGLLRGVSGQQHRRHLRIFLAREIDDIESVLLLLQREVAQQKIDLIVRMALRASSEEIAALTS